MATVRGRRLRTNAATTSICAGSAPMRRSGQPQVDAATQRPAPARAASASASRSSAVPLLPISPRRQIAEADADAAAPHAARWCRRGRSRCRRDAGRRPADRRGWTVSNSRVSNLELPKPRHLRGQPGYTANEPRKSVALRPVDHSGDSLLSGELGSWELEVDMTASESELNPHLHLPLVVAALRREGVGSGAARMPAASVVTSESLPTRLRVEQILRLEEELQALGVAERARSASSAGRG